MLEQARELSRGRADVAALAEQLEQPHVRLDERRVALERRLEQVLGFGGFAALEQHRGEPVTGARAARIGGQHAPQRVFRLRRPALLREQQAVVEQGAGMLGTMAQDDLELARRRGERAADLVDAREHDARLDEIGLARERRAHQALGFAQVAAGLEQPAQVVARVRIGGVEADRLAVRGQRALRVPGRLEAYPQLQIRLGVSGRRRDRLAIMPARLGGLSRALGGPSGLDAALGGRSVLGGRVRARGERRRAPQEPFEQSFEHGIGPL